MLERHTPAPGPSMGQAPPQARLGSGRSQSRRCGRPRVREFIMPKTDTIAADEHVVRPGARLLSKSDVLDKVGVTYPTIWKLMRQGTFPRSVVVGGKVAWLEHEVDEFIANLPRRR